MLTRLAAAISPRRCRLEFGKAIDPAGRRAMGRRGVEHAHSRVFDGGDGIPRRLVRQAQNREIDLIQSPGAGGEVFAIVLGKRHERDIGARCQTLADFQSGRSGAAIDIDQGLQ